jgi:hypothetical protein
MSIRKRLIVFLGFAFLLLLAGCGSKPRMRFFRNARFRAQGGFG